MDFSSSHKLNSPADKIVPTAKNKSSVPDLQTNPNLNDSETNGFYHAFLCLIDLGVAGEGVGTEFCKLELQVQHLY